MTDVQPISQSNWPNLQKAAFWNEDNTTMKIVKIVTAIFLVPLALIADLAIKGLNLVWSNKNVEPEAAPVKANIAKRFARATAQKTTNLAKATGAAVANHKKALAATAAVGTAVVVAYNFVPITGTRVGNTFCNWSLGFCAQNAAAQTEVSPATPA